MQDFLTIDGPDASVFCVKRDAVWIILFLSV